jgi:hypothetical protein
MALLKKIEPELFQVQRYLFIPFIAFAGIHVKVHQQRPDGNMNSILHTH